MGKYKAARPRTDAPPQIKPGVPCLFIIAIGIALTLFLLYEVFKNG